jgi:uroporphyrinogen decarboxylase
VGNKQPALFLRTLDGERSEHTPIWLMRQAGRYLPEYREVRERAGSFLNLCYSPAMAAEVTLQPIRRFGFDAAILFSDILVIPHALGQHVEFVEGEGPRLDPIVEGAALAKLSERPDPARLAAIYETVSRVRGRLGPETALIGFCGAPWTVASYMIAGKGTPDQAPIRLTAYRDGAFLSALVDRLVAASADYLVGQLEAGAQVVQIFESFAGALPPQLFERWSLEPIGRIATAVKAVKPDAKIIVFARGAAGGKLEALAQSGIADGVGLDWGVDLGFARERIQPRQVTQGNLDPLALVAGGEALDRGIDAILNTLGGKPHIFNLGHGILPETPIAHVERLVKRVRGN